MNMRSLKPALLGSLIASVALPLHATSVYTDPVGAVVVDVVPGFQTMSVGLQKAKVFQGAVDSVNGDSIGVTVGADVLASPHYVQVLSGDAMGTIATVVDADGSSVTTSPAILGLAAGDSIAVRPHVTLGDIATEPEMADGSTITIYNPDGTSELFEYFSSATLGTDEGIWGDAASEPANEVAIFPGEGFVLNNSGAAVSATFVGAVSVDAVALPVGPSFSIVGSLNPVSTSTLAGVYGSVAPGTSITVYSADGQLSVVEIYEAFDAADLGMGEGIVFGDSANEIADDDVLAAFLGTVVNPSAPGVLMIPAAYSAE